MVSEFLSMVSWPCCCRPVVGQCIMAGAGWRRPAHHLMAVKERDKGRGRGLESQYPFQGHSPSGLTSSQ